MSRLWTLACALLTLHLFSYGLLACSCMADPVKLMAYVVLTLAALIALVQLIRGGGTTPHG